MRTAAPSVSWAGTAARASTDTIPLSTLQARLTKDRERALVILKVGRVSLATGLSDAIMHGVTPAEYVAAMDENEAIARILDAHAYAHGCS